jgi:hypothetical protein
MKNICKIESFGTSGPTGNEQQTTGTIDGGFRPADAPITSL